MRAAFSAVVLGIALSGCADDEPSPYPTIEFEIPANGMVEGDAAAPLVLVEFGSYSCPACRVLADSVLPSVEARFIRTGALQYRYVDASPPLADRISGLVECAAAKVGPLGARRDFYRLIDEHLDSLRGLLEHSDCEVSPTGKVRRSSERSLARKLGVPGTPTLVVGRWHRPNRVVGWAVLGSLSKDSLFKMIEAADAQIADR